ncbi:MAG TPA: GAF domain-containing protein [Mycobacterium sp.]|nr:GAF domain-containing protein [Mycobacterium sp.]
MSLLVQPTAPPLWLGAVVAAAFILAETIMMRPLMVIAPGNTFGVIYLLGVLVVSARWGFGISAMTTLASTLAYAYVHFSDEGSFLPTEVRGWVAILIFAPIAILANAVAGQARLRTAEAIQRRNEAEASRDEIRVLADQQAALHRVATLVARAVAPSEVFSAVTRELAGCLGVPHATLCRYEPDGSATLVAIHDENAKAILPVGTRLSFEGENVVAMVFRTGRVVRMDSHKDAPGKAAEYIRALGFGSGVGVPIVVAGRLWGAAVVGCSRPLPPDTEARVGDFADLVATAIANADARSELTASRARIVAAGDDARRRFERNLHDGAQQRLVSLGLQLRIAQAGVPPECPALGGQISDAVAGLTDISDELQEISRGMHPAVLSRGGLGPAIKMLARRSTIPVEVEQSVDQRLPEYAEVAAYYVLAEALTNAAKHAQATVVRVSCEVDGANLCLMIRDDGVGGADLARGSGLLGLKDRVEAVGGQLQIASIAGRGTSLSATIPLAD